MHGNRKESSHLVFEMKDSNFYCEPYRCTMSIKKCVFYFRNVNPTTKTVHVNDFANRSSYSLDRWNCVDCPKGKENSEMDQLTDNQPIKATKDSHIEPTKRVCAKCGEAKLITEFWKKKGNKDGLDTACRACIKKYNNEWYAKKHKKNGSSQPQNQDDKKLFDPDDLTKSLNNFVAKKKDSQPPPIDFAAKVIHESAETVGVPIPDFEYKMMKFFADKANTPIDEFMIDVIRAGILTILEDRYVDDPS